MTKLDTEIQELYKRIEEYAARCDLRDTKSVLAHVKRHLMDEQTDLPMKQEYLLHGLQMAWLLITLQLKVEAQEMDLMLATSVLHILPELSIGIDETELNVRPQVIAYVKEITRFDHLAEDEVENYYRTLAKDRLLLMIKMVERSNLIEHLCDMTADEAKTFMWETKRHLFLMCLDGKENYPEFENAFGNIMEKMRGLIQVMDILYKKYDAEEDELYDEIWSLTEENARIRKAIREWN